VLEKEKKRLAILRASSCLTSVSYDLEQLRIHLHVAALDWYLREIIGTNKLAGTWFDDIIEKDFADCVLASAWFPVVENSKEGCVKLVVENRIAGLLN
jgi:hypothetical protein